MASSKSLIKPSILIIGAGGMLGYAAHKYFLSTGYQVTTLTRKDFDIGHHPVSSLKKFISKTDFVLNCAGIIKPRIETHSIEDVLKVNSIFPHNLASLCQQHMKPCFHITTDCVFSGNKGKYVEIDLIDATDLYGLSKAAGDTPLCMTLRTSIIGEEFGQARSLISWAKSQSGKTVNGFTNHRWNGVTTVYLSEIIATIINKGLYRSGIFHIHSPRAVTKYQLLKTINQTYQLNLTVNKYQDKHNIDRTLASVYPLSQLVVSQTVGQQIKVMRDFFAK